MRAMPNRVGMPGWLIWTDDFVKTFVAGCFRCLGACEGMKGVADRAGGAIGGAIGGHVGFAMQASFVIHCGWPKPWGTKWVDLFFFIEKFREAVP